MTGSLRRLRYRLEYALLRLVVRVVELLPRRAAFALAKACGSLLHALLRGRVKLGREQAAAALSLPADGPEVAAIVRASFRHFARVPFEVVTLHHELARRPAIDILGRPLREHIDSVLAHGAGAILATGHIGNWEILGSLLPLTGTPCVSIGRRIENPLLDAEVTRLRTRFGVRVFDKEGGGLKLARELKRGGVAAVLLDQHAGRSGMRMPFFHADASTFTFVATVAHRFQVPVVPIFAACGPRPFEFETIMHPPIWPDASLPEPEDAWRIMALFNRRLEAAVRAVPGQYLWAHRRWKKGGQEPDPAWRARYAAAE